MASNSNFPWLHDIHPPTVTESLPPTPQSKPKWKSQLQRLKPAVPWIALLAGIGTFAAISRRSSDLSATQNAPKRIEVLRTRMALPKSTEVRPELLGLTSVDRKDLTASVRNNLVRKEDLSDLAGRMYFKKAIPPNKILTWNDVDLELPKRGSSPKRGLRIHSSKSNLPQSISTEE